MYSYQPGNSGRRNANVPSHRPNQPQPMWATDVHPHDVPTECVENAMQYIVPGPTNTQVGFNSSYQGYHVGAQGVASSSANTAHRANGASTNITWAYAQIAVPLSPQCLQPSATGTATRHTARPPSVVISTPYSGLYSGYPDAAEETMTGNLNGMQQACENRDMYRTCRPVSHTYSPWSQYGSDLGGRGSANQPVEICSPMIGLESSMSPETWRDRSHKTSEETWDNRTTGYTPTGRNQDRDLYSPEDILDSEQEIPVHMYHSTTTNGETNNSWDSHRLGARTRVLEPRSLSPSPSSGSGTSQDPVFCSVCGKRFNGAHGKGNLGRHRRQKHGDQEQCYSCEDGVSTSASPEIRVLLLRHCHDAFGPYLPPGGIRRIRSDDDSDVYAKNCHACAQRGSYTERLPAGEVYREALS
ncbi:hypothetical protein PMIN01_00527 [Paraphaeosphaeria minitans]|uniref:C2H2-type domain-containing protein n=1 Tax=Paraphaeosphaeria minitans TaxID=565426 RepID=A0A9P6GT03_9PLEO|nr:hypothetical protein PMIN01_00527 [Paraphaeosphaeria minitans]